ncbi:glycosyltransferase family 2 protein [Methylobacterium sp. J-078]|uniref:glycosyltransferase family 2 protein n=1 Tax=Methylobacterium sp. J-078 TaxID=2836657 RepID=UPI001FBAEBF6|nr:glycosyltransferase family 2 protein [Methylobacterium sp. J-078]MCJ2043408.1 glycosyltransferase family 2 protein [Methylobacterium sp. J-078]
MLTYRGDPVARPLRPLLRLTRHDGRRETFVLPGPVLGAAQWLGYLPADCAGLELATDRRSGFVLERVGLRGSAQVLAECLRRRPLRAVAAVFNALRRDERRFRDILRGSCGVTPLDRYAIWARARARAETAPVPMAPVLRLILPATPGKSEAIEATLDSVRAQSFTAWTLVLAETEADPARKLTDARMTRRAWSETASLGSLAGRADAVVLLEPGDRLDPDALATLAHARLDAAEPELVYADAVIEGAPATPRLKPDWSPDLARVSAYPGTPILYAGELLQRLATMPLGEPDTLPLRLLLEAAAEVAPDRVSHIPRVLARQAAPDSAEAGQHAAILAHHLAARGAPARVATNAGGFDLLWPLPAPALLVSVIIPSRDRLDLIRRSSDDVLNATAYPALELVIVDNGSTDPAVLAHYEILSRDPRVTIHAAPGPFNFSALINAGVAVSRGAVVVLLNNDVAVLREDWLEALVRQACRPEVGAVGAKLLYGDGTLQHAGVVVGLGGRAGHILRRRPADTAGHLGRLRVAHEVSAVTAACLAVERRKFDAVGGLDAETFAVDFNDVDFCLRLGAAGYRTIWTPRAVLAHLESTSRGPALGPARARFEAEAEAFVARWRDTIRHDPFYHPGLSLTTFGEDLE